MATQVQNRRGSTAEHSTFTGAVGEVTIDTDKDTAVVHDGSTAGGRPLLREDLSNLPAGTIDNADINASAAIAGTKVSPNFGSQNVTTTGTSTAASFIPTSSTAPTNGLYLSAANSVALSTNGTGRLFVRSGGLVEINPSATEANARMLLVRGTGAADGAVLLKSSSTPDGNTRGFLVQSFGASSDAYVWQQENSPLILGTNATERLRITSAGLVGIGTSSPSYALDIRGSSVTAAQILSSGSDAALFLKNTTASTGREYYFSSQNNGRLGLVDATAGAARVTLDESGRVGIGTTSPSNALHVEYSSATLMGLRVRNTDTTATAVNGIDLSVSNGSAGAYFYVDSAVSGGSPYNVHIKRGQANASICFDNSAGTEHARINSSGRLGIGTTSPDQLVHLSASTDATLRIESTSTALTTDTVVGRIEFEANDGSTFGTGIKAAIGAYSDIAAGTSVSLRMFAGSGSASTGTERYRITGDGQHIFGGADGISSAERARIDSSGRLGIGTTGPNYELHVNASDALSGIQLTNTSTGTTASDGFLIYNNGVNATISNEESGYLRFQTAGIERAQIDSSGRLLVGTNSTSSVNRLIVQSSSDAPTGAGTLFLARGDNAPLTTNVLGALRFGGSTHVNSAEISAFRDGGTWTAGSSLPTGLTFSTTADGAASPTERLRITNDGVLGYNQPAPVAVDTTATLTVANLKTGIITSSTAAAVTMTLPTGTLTEGGFSGLYNNFTFQWTVINTGATNAVTVQGDTGHTLVGSGTVAAGVSGRFASRRTAANTFVTYRLS